MIRKDELPAVPAGVHLAGSQRIGDSERTRYTEHLNDLYAQGYLPQAEWQARTAAATAATTKDDLLPLLLDLPGLPPEPRVNGGGDDRISIDLRVARRRRHCRTGAAVVTLLMNAVTIAAAVSWEVTNPRGDAASQSLSLVFFIAGLAGFVVSLGLLAASLDR